MTTAAAHPHGWRARLFDYHRRTISQPRAQRIAACAAELLSPQLPARPTLLDVGCGDGHIANLISQRLQAQPRGVDIKLQPDCIIDAERYQGDTLPFDDDSFDAVTLCDVLHHAGDPERLLRQCLRVARHALFVKDHFAQGPLAHEVLWLMDRLGNARTQVAVTGRYFNQRQWSEMLARAQASETSRRWPLLIHDMPWRLVTRSELQFAALVLPPAREQATALHG